MAFVAFAASYYMRAELTSTAAPIDFTIPQLIQGLAMGTFFVAILIIMLDGIEPAARTDGFRPGYLLSSIDYFWISSWLTLALIALVWLTRRPVTAPAHAAAD